MDIVSINIGNKQIIYWQEKKVSTGIFKFPVNEPVLLEKTDVSGDVVVDRRYHGGADKACYIYGAQHYSFWREKYPGLKWEWGMFGENLTAEGFDESKVCIGDIYRVGTALVQVTQPRQPCFKLGIRMEDPKAVKEFIRAEKPGGYLRVLETGNVAAGNSMTLMKRNAGSLTLQEVFHLLYHGNENPDKVEIALKMPELAESCKNDLRKIL